MKNFLDTLDKSFVQTQDYPYAERLNVEIATALAVAAPSEKTATELVKYIDIIART